MLPAPPLDPGFALYVHWPYCLAKCPYCDFNSHVRPKLDQRIYRRAILRELADARDLTHAKPLRSVFFGGGTPSLMDPATVQDLLAMAEDMFGFEDGIEITLEANPTSIEADKLEAFAKAGINRLSLGIQSFDDAALRFLGREHDRADAARAITATRAVFDRWSFDLIYARPGQEPAVWLDELRQALSFGAQHISLYQLTIEPGTAFDRLHRAGRIAMPRDDVQAELYQATLDCLRGHGFARYEISNYARPNEVCRHNLVYWRHGDYLGIGPGAHGRVSRSGKRYATRSERLPERWRKAVEAGASLILEEIEPSDQLVEYLMMGLRLEDGVAIDRLKDLELRATKPVLDRSAIDRMIDQGLMRRTNERLFASDRGLLNLDGVLRQILL